MAELDTPTPEQDDLTAEGTFTVDAAVAWSGLGRSTLYKLEKEKRLVTRWAYQAAEYPLSW